MKLHAVYQIYLKQTRFHLHYTYIQDLRLENPNTLITRNNSFVTLMQNPRLRIGAFNR